VATAPNLKADSFTAGDTVVNNDGVKVGDKVIFGKYSGQTVKADGEELLVMREEDIFGIVE